MSDQSRNTVIAAMPRAWLGIGAPTPADPPVSPQIVRAVQEQICSPRFDAWSEALAAVGNCAHPVRLRGSSTTVERATGEVLASYSSEGEALGVTHVRCGNRRAEKCASCSRLYAADMFHLIRAGAAGGKGVPQSVTDNPLVFATLTAPSFGAVHSRRDNRRPCTPAAPSRCPHGNWRGCRALHAEDDPVLGQPICGDCYDYASHVVWQWWAPDLWRRFTITLGRRVAHELGVPATRLPDVATVQYAKVAEYQRRGAVHFHALIRLDGPRQPGGFAPAPAALDAAHLAILVQEAAASVQLTVPGVDSDDPARVLAFGRQLDARPVRHNRRTDNPDETLIPEQVAGYLAKYATKSVGDTDPAHSPHHRRLDSTVRALATRADSEATAEGEPGPYELLGKWAHMLGFRGHFASKSRRYSVTLGALRRARRRAQALLAAAKASGETVDLAQREAELLADDDTETTLVIRQWQYVGSGWADEAQTVLANAAAARAREYAQERAQARAQTALTLPRTSR